MKLISTLSIVIAPAICYSQHSSFTSPDTVCVNAPVTVTNTSTGGSSFYWSFCGNNLLATPQATNIGNPGNKLDIPVFSETIKEGNNYFTFIVNNNGGNRGLVRLAYGNSLLNNPVITDFGNLGGAMKGTAEGLQIVKDANGWHIITIGGNTPASIFMVKISFGSSLGNANPQAVDWGNIGNLSYATDLYIFKENNAWYGFTTNASSNTITRFSFGASFTNPPTATNLGNLGNLSWPTGVFAIKVNNNWYVFVCNADASTITRLNFGTSLLNVPTAVNLGNASGRLNHCRDLTIVNDCDHLSGLVANGDGNDILKIEFAGNSITGAINATSYGNIGNLNYPHSLSPLIREGDKLYTFVTNAFNNTITRVMFPGCANSSVPSSSQVNPASFSYAQPGNYSIKLVMDEGLITQETACRNIVVMPPLSVNLGTNIKVCDGTPVVLNAGTDDVRYVWSDNSNGHQLIVTTSGTYSVMKFNGGCKAADAVSVLINPPINVTATVADAACGDKTGTINAVTTGGTSPYKYVVNSKNFGTTPTFAQLPEGVYNIEVEDGAGCKSSTQVTINLDEIGFIRGTITAVPPSCDGNSDATVTLAIQKGTPPFDYALAGQPFQTDPVFSGMPAGTYKFYARNDVCIDSFDITVTAPAPVVLNTTVTDAYCDLPDGKLEFDVEGGTPPYTYSSNGMVSGPVSGQLFSGDYLIKVADANGCDATASYTVNNITPPPITILNNDTTINIGEKIRLQAINGVDYEWLPTEGLSCTTCPDPVAQPLVPTTYIVHTVTGRNCIAADTINVKLTHYQYLYIPTAFSPNHDGNNDYFRVKSTGINQFKMSIYNRWGELIFVGANPGDGWDGRFKNVLQLAGTYVYMIEYAYYGQHAKPLLQKGVLTLIK
jgi:gliding motility-associated-like protein